LDSCPKKDIGKAEGEKLTATQKLEQKEIIIIIKKKKGEQGP
jgi:hypothetical protein